MPRGSLETRYMRFTKPPRYVNSSAEGVIIPNKTIQRATPYCAKVQYVMYVNPVPGVYCCNVPVVGNVYIISFWEICWSQQSFLEAECKQRSLSS